MAIRRSAAPASELRYESSGRRVRAMLAGEPVADTRRPLLVWEPGKVLPLYAFPREDVLLERVPVRALRNWDDPDLAEHVGLDWQSMDAWYEEDEEVFVHPRDPYHRVDVLQSSRHVRVELDGQVLSESSRPRLLFETGLPTRFYLPQDDVRMDLLEPTATHTRCPYKGLASYWSARVGNALHEDVAWSYPEPIPEAPSIRGLIAFFDERVDTTVDGEWRERPRTQWSPA